MSSATVWKTLTSASATGFAFDGTYLYISEDTHINKVNMSTGSINTSWATGFNSTTRGSVIDGGYLYVLDGYATIKRVVLATGVIDNTFVVSLGTNALFLAIQNGVIYVGCVDHSSVATVNISTKQVNLDWMTSFIRPLGVTIYNNVLYVICNDSSIKKIVINSDGTGTLIAGFTSNLPLGSEPTAVVNDGTYLYATASRINKIIQVSLETGAVVNSNLVNGIANWVYDVFYLNGKLYFSCENNNNIYVIDAPSGSGSGSGSSGSSGSSSIYTPIYLGKATVDASGDFNLAHTVMYTQRFPADQSELVPRAYVDQYLSSVVSYFKNILDASSSSAAFDASGNPITTIGRITYLEAQLEVVYKALWNVHRNASTINTPQLGSIPADYNRACSGNSQLVANSPTPPSTLTGFQ